MSEKNSLCKFLEWDSAFFNRRIGRVEAETATDEELEQIMQWSRENQIDCLYFLINSRDPVTTKLAENIGFHLVDMRVTLGKNVAPHKKPENSSVREARIDDLTELKKIASVNHRDSRFYYDGNFPKQKCDELFSVWIENSFKKDFADVVFVTQEDDKPTGYITCSLNKEGLGNIGLVGVASQLRGKGIGKILVSSALNWFANNNASYVSVVTQGRNVEAQRLYQKNGFVTNSVKIWYHLWLT